jgi:alpha-amylase
MTSHQWLIDRFLDARKYNAHGDQYDYFDHPDCIGWTRTGNEENPNTMAVILSNGEDGSKYMETTSPETIYIDITEQIEDTVKTNKDGWGEFRCNASSVSVWVPK